MYLACWVPRSQTEVIEWIYGKTPTNIRPVIRARRVLVQLGYLEHRRVEDLRKIELISKPEPFVPYAENRIKTRRSLKGKRHLSERERSVLLRVLDSDWFRQSFDQDLVYRKSWLAGEGSLQTIAEFLEEVCAISYLVGFYLSCEMPTLKDVLLFHTTFDDFMEKWSSQKLGPYPRIKKNLAYVGANLRDELPSDPALDLLIKNTLDEPPFPALCIPRTLAEKLETVGRVPLSLVLSLVRVLRKAVADEEL